VVDARHPCVVISFVVLGSQWFQSEAGTLEAERDDEGVCYETHAVMVGAEQLGGLRI
jgi:hypothetical protein